MQRRRLASQVGLVTVGRGRSVVLLSDKSSGSSLAHRLLVAADGANGISWTGHQERESLYWAKAAAALSLPQPRMSDSRIVPMTKYGAQEALITLLTNNNALPASAVIDKRFVMDGWRALVDRHAPVFVEKSPHHLHNSHSLDLLLDAAQTVDPDMKLVGLVRHPVDTLYSMWRRWGIPPQRRQHEWVRAYRNLLDLRSRSNDRLFIVRYEDLLTQPPQLLVLYRHCGLRPPDETEQLRASSITAWRADRAFRFTPTRDLVETADKFGYQVEPVRGTFVMSTIAHTRLTARRMKGRLGRSFPKTALPRRS